MSFLDLGIVAHVDAGKTTLTERLLYEAGVTDAPGSVDAGTTRTDTMDLERRRGITIRAAVTSFAIGDLTVNLVDTPGHPDFIAEVERSLAVLDAAVLVLSAVEGVQPQTVVIWRALQRIGIPAALFINKIDRAGADVDTVVGQIRRRLSPSVVVLARAERQGTADASVHRVDVSDESVVVAVAEQDDRILARWVHDDAPGKGELRRALRQGVRRGGLTPVVCGSAITGAGMSELGRVLTRVLPRATCTGSDTAATVFAVDHDEHGRRSWVRMWGGRLRVRERVSLSGRSPERISALEVGDPAGIHQVDAVVAGGIAVIRGPATSRVGDVVGCPPPRRTHRFAPATLQALVEPVDPTQRTALFTGLAELADEDPLIGLRLDETDGEAAVSLHGEVQKEVIAALLEERYGVRAAFCETSTVCLERVVGEGAALDRLGVDDNPYLATIGLRVEAAEAGHGVQFSAGAERGNLPTAFIAATEDGVRTALRQGLSGWAVTDCVVTMTTSGYYPRQSHMHQKFNKKMSSVANDFRHLSAVVVMEALGRAGTCVCEPVDRFDLELPEDVLGPAAAVLGRLGGVVLQSSTSGDYTRLVGRLGSARVPELARRLPDLTGGEGVLVTRLDHHAPVTGERVPARRHTGPDPRDRAGWFRDMPR